jgi:sec-independent protein translocase protein TatA
MIGDLFDSPWKIAIIAIVVIVLFGSKKLPGAARSLGQSMRILKAEVQGLHEDDSASVTTAYQGTPSSQPTPGQLQTGTTAPAVDAQAQIDALSRQLADLQQTVTVNKATDGAQAQ